MPQDQLSILCKIGAIGELALLGAKAADADDQTGHAALYRQISQIAYEAQNSLDAQEKG